MSPTVKGALKEARVFIDKKDYKSALKCCNRALNADPSHYLALVFAALCQAETEQYQQAVETYKRAIKQDVAQVTAYQGLASLYEKHLPKMGQQDVLSRQKDQADTYRSLIELIQDRKKRMEVMTKLWRLHLVMDDLGSALDVLKEQLEVAEEGEEKRLLRSEAIDVCNRRLALLNEDQDKFFVEVLEASLSAGDQSVQSQLNHKTLIKMHYKMRNLSGVYRTALSFLKAIPNYNTFAQEFISKVFLEWCSDTVEIPSMDPEVVRAHAEAAVELGGLTLSQLARGALLWRDGKLDAAKRALNETLDRPSVDNFYGYYVLCRVLLQRNELAELAAAAKKCKNLLYKVKEDDRRKILDFRVSSILARCLYRLGRIEEATKVLTGIEQASRDLLEEDQELKLIAERINATNCQSKEKGEEQLKRLQDRDFPADEITLIRGLLARTVGDFDQARSHLQEALKSKPDNFQALVTLAVIEIEKGSSEKSLPHLLRAAKSDPHSPVPFLQLGRAYFERWKRSREEGAANSAVLDRARKCLQKGLLLSGGEGTESHQVGAMLSDIYRAQGAFDSNLEFLTSITHGTTASAGTAAWAHLRIGMLHLEQDDPSKAIVSLQSALRGDPDSVVTWECLADAYKARGSHTAAIKAFEQVLSLSPGCEYALLQLGHLRLLLGHFHDALNSFREVSSKLLQEKENDSDHSLLVPALKGLAETLLAEAMEAMEEVVDKRVVACCQEAIKALVKAASLSGSISCLWKLLGEACTMMRDLPEEAFNDFSVPSVLLNPNASLEDSTSVSKKQALEIGGRCYLRATRSGPDLPSAWRDLALNYHARSTLEEEGEEREKLSERAMSAAKKCLALQPKSAEAWNLLGFLAINRDKYALAQHALVQSVTLESNAQAWANLGILYLITGNAALANRSFNECQESDPSWPAGWMGQARLAELQGMGEEAMDLARHATFLGGEGMAYARWVCRTLVSKDAVGAHSRYCVEKMHGVTVAVDCLERFTRRRPCDVGALNMLGILLEREGRLRSARAALERSLALTPGDASLSRSNLARVCLKLGDFDSAIEHGSRAMETAGETGGGDLECAATLAAAHLGAGHFKEAYQAYQTCLTLSGDALKGHFLVALASIAYRFQGADAAKTLLYQSCQVDPPSVHGLFALCVLGFKEGDPSLVEATLSELVPHSSSAANAAAISGLRALSLSTVRGDAAAARRHLAQQVRRFPQQADLWRTAAAHLVFAKGDHRVRELEAAAWMAERATAMDRIDSSGKAKDDDNPDSNLSSFALLLSLWEQQDPSAADAAPVSDQTRRRLRRAAAAAVHARPGDPAAALLLALAQGQGESRFDWLLSRAQTLLASPSSSSTSTAADLRDYVAAIGNSVAAAAS